MCTDAHMYIHTWEKVKVHFLQCSFSGHHHVFATLPCIQPVFVPTALSAPRDVYNGWRYRSAPRSTLLKDKHRHAMTVCTKLCPATLWCFSSANFQFCFQRWLTYCTGYDQYAVHPVTPPLNLHTNLQTLSVKNSEKVIKAVYPSAQCCNYLFCVLFCCFGKGHSNPRAVAGREWECSWSSRLIQSHVQRSISSPVMLWLLFHLIVVRRL